MLSRESNPLPHSVHLSKAQRCKPESVKEHTLRHYSEINYKALESHEACSFTLLRAGEARGYTMSERGLGAHPAHILRTPALPQTQAANTGGSASAHGSYAPPVTPSPPTTSSTNRVGRVLAPPFFVICHGLHSTSRDQYAELSPYRNTIRNVTICDLSLMHRDALSSYQL
jgi:hypothetical protein